MLSIVIPVYNEEESLRPLHEALLKSLSNMGLEWEIIFVDDGSSDATLEKLIALSSGDLRIRIVELSRNFGHQPALAKGLECAKGDWIVTMHSDLEDRPEDIPLLYAKAQEGYDVVYTVRGSDQKAWFKDIGSRIFYFLFERLSDFPIPVNTGDYCIMSRPVVDVLNSLPERHRYLAGLRSWVGFRQTGLLLPRAERAHGEPKQSYSRLLIHAADAIFSFSTVPLKVMTLLGVAFLMGLIACFIIMVMMRLFLPAYQHIPIGWASLMTMIVFIGGLLLVGLGVIGTYLSRIYDEVRKRPTTLVRRIISGDR